MVRRKRPQDDGLNLPPHLLPAVVHQDPDGWKADRFEWSRLRDWGPGKLGLLAFFDETVYWHRTALGRQVPIGCLERHEAVMRGRRGDVQE